MILGLGPVLRYELITTARRGRYYLARVIYGLSLLIMLWGEFRTWESTHPAGGNIEEVHQFAESTFIQFAGVQGLALLGLIPALVAGVIADDHQRKTLHYLLASRLSSGEIVLGKLGARLLHVGTFVALGLPVVCLLALYGGLNPENVFYVYLGTFTLSLSVAGSSILVSVMARRPRDAVLAAYALVAVWLVGPPMMAPIAHSLGWAFEWYGPVNDWMLLTSPAQVWSQMTRMSMFRWRFGMPFWGLGGFKSQFYWMAGTQALAGIAFIGLAIAGLRPLRGTSWPGARPGTGWWTRLSTGARRISLARFSRPLAHNRILAEPSRRPPCGEAPMFWKERYATMGGGLRWLGSRYVLLFFGVLLGCYLLDVAAPAVSELAGGQLSDHRRSEMNVALREASTASVILAMLTVAAASAVSLTGEREQDTWISLATTLLTPGEVIRAKQFGAVWSARWAWLSLIVVWAIGLLLGAIHPLGVLAATAIVANAAWLIAATGVFVSCRARNSTRALAWTFIALLIGLGNGPGLLWDSLVSYSEVDQLSLNQALPVLIPLSVTRYLSAGFLSTTIITAAFAGLLSIWSIRRLGATWGQG
ncbi:MAG: ABC transporter permease [Isosphaeraceae bacterium]